MFDKILMVKLNSNQKIIKYINWPKFGFGMYYNNLESLECLLEDMFIQKLISEQKHFIHYAFNTLIELNYDRKKVLNLGAN